MNLTAFIMPIYQICTLAVLLQLCTFGCLAAVPIAPNTLTNKTLPNSNLTEKPPSNLTLNPEENALPPSPYIYPVPDSTLKIKFQAFGHLVPRSDVLFCLLLAANDVNQHFDNPSGLMGTDTHQYSSAVVRLNLYPRPNAMTWAKWGAAVRGITDFMIAFDFVDLDFYVLDDEVGGRVVAGGFLTDS